MPVFESFFHWLSWVLFFVILMMTLSVTVGEVVRIYCMYRYGTINRVRDEKEYE